MKKIICALFFATIFFSCNSSGLDKYTINATVQHGENKTIYLEKLTLSAITIIDSGKTDAKGKVTLSNTAEKGFYRLRMDNRFWMFLLENQKYTIDFDYNTPITYNIKGTAGAEEFKTTLDFVAEKQMELSRLNEEFYRRQNSGQSADSLQAFAMSINAVGAAFEASLKSKLKQAKEPMVALYVVSLLPMNKYPEENKSIIERLEKEAPTSSYTKDMRAQYNQIEGQLKAAEMQKQAESATEIGAKAIDLEYMNTSGQKMKLSSLKGKVVLLDFWASWCGPCRRENPAVVAAYNKYNSKGFEIFSVSLDQDANKWKAAIQADGLSWPYHVSDLKGWSSEPAAKYGVHSIPAQFLIDTNGVIIAKNLRGEELEKKLAEVLK